MNVQKNVSSEFARRTSNKFMKIKWFSRRPWSNGKCLWLFFVNYAAFRHYIMMAMWSTVIMDTKNLSSPFILSIPEHLSFSAHSLTPCTCSRRPFHAEMHYMLGYMNPKLNEFRIKECNYFLLCRNWSVDMYQLISSTWILIASEENGSIHMRLFARLPVYRDFDFFNQRLFNFIRWKSTRASDSF